MCKVALLERVDHMDTTLMPISIETRNAYSKGGIPLNVAGVAHVKLPGAEPRLSNAVERFLDAHPSQIAIAAQQTLEGVLREVRHHHPALRELHALSMVRTGDLARLRAELGTWSPAKRGVLHKDGRWLALEYDEAPISIFYQRTWDELDGIEHQVCETVLEAEVTEIRLIHAHRPRHNRRSRPPKSSHFVKLTNEEFPRLSVVRTIRDDGLAYLGPFRSKRGADEVVLAIWDALPIRRCRARPGE